MTVQIYSNAVVFAPEGEALTTSTFAVKEGRFVAVGSREEVEAAVVGSDTEEVDLAGRFVMPGFVDGHTHLGMFGESLGKAQLRDCSSLAEIQQRLLDWRAQHPDAPRLLGMGWLFDAVGDERPTRQMLDEVLPDVPVYLDANDLHSAWVNSAALRELGITRETPDPIGGEIARDSDGEATGMLYETACTQHVWAFLRQVTTPEDLVARVEAAFAAYLADGVTTVTDMALDAGLVQAIRSLLKRDGRLPFPLTGHWIVEPSGDTDTDLAVVAKVVALRDELEASGEAEWFGIAGMKFIMDGVIDACTAAMRDPYANGTNADPIWHYEAVCPVAAAADAAGLQLALHAIGDHASEIAVDVIEHCIAENGERARRHRIEHLESCTEETIERMARLGVVGSMQPVHCDPAVMPNWKAVLGDERQETGFPWHWLRKKGVACALGTDAPTAPHHTLPNLYIALTGRSALDTSLDAYHPERVFTPEEAIIALTHGGAFAGQYDDRCGRIAPGLQANFAVLGVNPLTADPNEVLAGSVEETYVLGQRRFAA